MKTKTTKKIAGIVIKKKDYKKLEKVSEGNLYLSDTNLQAEYKASIKILGKIYSATGSTAKEAIENLKPTGKCAGVSVITVSKGEKKRERILTSTNTFRLFSLSPTTRQIAIKNMSILFDNI